MLDPKEWREQFVKNAATEIRDRRISKSAVARYFAELMPESRRVTKQGVYYWFTTGKIKPESLAELARYGRYDVTALRMNAQFVEEKPSTTEPVKNGPEPIAAIIGRKVARLDPTIQNQLLELIESIINVADPRYWEFNKHMAETSERLRSKQVHGRKAKSS